MMGVRVHYLNQHMSIEQKKCSVCKDQEYSLGPKMQNIPSFFVSHKFPVFFKSVRPFQEQIYLEMGGNDDGQGEDENLANVHHVVHICPGGGAGESDYLFFIHTFFVFLLRQSLF